MIPQPRIAAPPDRLMEIVDLPMPPREEIRPHECLASMPNISLSCSDHSARERMNMSDVAALTCN